jgi:hypothetical protein
VPLPATDAVPIVIPPLVQVVGGPGWGPNTVKVMVPLAPVVAPDRLELIELAAICDAAVPAAGATAVVLVAFVTAVEVIPAPQPLFDGLLLASPL